MEFERDSALKEWAKDQPFTILALNPADRAVLRIADERDAIQKKTFTKWVNKHLKKVRRFVNDLFEDLRDGHNLISLLEVLTGDNLPREKGIMRFHMLQNIETALHFLHCKKIKLVNIRSEDIVDGNPKLTLGLIWTIILHFQISDVVGHESDMSAREVLLKWSQRTASKYPSVHITDFTSSWRDGLAFNALVHRNRPDLIDWRIVKNQMTVRERLEYVFHIIEKEYGVTRLLDPEDVDTPEPDEKSIITYVSSIYDVFPEPPSIHPLYDTKLQQRYYEYREIAHNLSLWMHEKTSMMQDYTFPNNLIEMRKVESESARFRNEEIPPKQRDKQRLHHLYKDVERYFEIAGSTIDLESELQVQNIEKQWNKLLISHEEREMSLIEETKRLEKLQRLAEKVNREIKYTESRLENLDKRVEDDGRRVDRLHPLEAKQASDILEQDIVSCEKIIQNLFSDVQVLKDGRYTQSIELQKRVQQLHQQWVQIRSLFHNKILSKLAHLTFPVEERTVTKQTRTVLETRLVDTNPHFRQLQDCIDWCKKKLEKLQESEYGSDLGSVQRELEQCHKETKNVEQFRGKYESCVKAKSNFHGDELSLYNQYLSQLQKLYSDVTVKLNNRLSDLDNLYDFIKSATNELSWLNDKEDVEISRDWADRNLNCTNIEQYYENLMNELEKREIQFTAVQDRGEALVLQHHPASKCIEAHMSAIQAQWAWLLQLTLCLEVHLKHAIFYQAFYTDVKQAEKWLLERDELLNLEFSQSEFTLDEGEKLLQGMQILRDELNNFGDTVQNLIQQGQQVVPLKLRRQPVTRPLPVQSICNYKQSNVVIKKGEQCTVLDNSGRIKWKVRNSQNDEANVPGVCFVIPPPDKEAIDAAERLRRQYDRTITLWQKKQLRMRQNMIFATIRVVKSWDLPQFLAIGAEQRNAIRKALNEDAEKLLAEGDPSDPQLRRLRREMDEVNRLFDELEKRARAEEESKNAARIFNEQVMSLQSILDDAEKLLHQRVMSSIPRDLDTLHHLVLEHKEFESRLQILENDIEQIKDTFRNITLKTPNMKKSLEKILDKWNNLWSLSHLYTERLKSLEITINGMEEAHTILSEFEMKLASFEDLPTTESALELVHDKLQSLQSAVGQQQIAMDQLNDDYESSKQLIEKSRPMQKSSMSHTDVDRLAHDITKLNQRWNTICNHLSERIKCCELAYKHLKEYNKSKEEEDKWLDDTFAKLRNLTPVKEQLEASKGILNATVERVPKIEDVNISGGKLIREGKQAIEEKQKLCDEQLTKLLDWISQIEQKLANQTVLSEDEAELRNQINTMKQIKDELFYRLTNVTHCTDQVRQLVLTGGDVLSKSEISDLEKRGRNLKTRFDQAIDRNERLLKCMYQSLEDLHKFRKELAAFATWLDKARRSLEDKEQLLSDLSHLNSNYENVKSFVSDVIAHQADLRFVTMSAQKFFDDSKNFLKAINEYRTSLPQRLSHIKPVLSHDSKLHSDVSYVTAQYKDLSARTNALSERMLGVGGRQKEYAEALSKAKKWLSDAEPRCLKMLSEPIAVEPKAIESQLNHAKNLANEFVNKGRLLDAARNALETLLNSLNNQLLPNEAKNLETPVIDLINKYNQLKEALAEKCQDLDNALIQSQGVTDSLDGVVDWLNSSETQFRNLQKPASLIKEKLEEQIHEHKLYESELDLHHASIDSVSTNANEFIAVSSKSANSTKIAKQIQAKLKDLKTRYDKLLENAAKRREFLNDIHSLLCDFLKQSQTLIDSFKEIGDVLQQKNGDFKDVILKKESLRNSFEDTVKKGKVLLSKRDVTDISNVRDTVNLLESEWKALNTNLDDKQKLIQQRSEQLNVYEKLRDQVLEWLMRMETKVSNFESVAIQNDILQKQIDELKPILKEFYDYENTIRSVEEAGLIYDNLVKSQRSDSPLTNKRASPFRSVKKSPMSIHKIVTTTNNRSPSPFHSSISSNKNNDSFHLDDVSITQQQLSDIYNRYNLLGVRLNDRQNELDNTKEELRKCVENLKTLRSFLDKTERQFPKDYASVLSTKDEADKIMKHVKMILEEIYEKQSLVDSTKTQIKDLLKRRPDSKGSENLNKDLLVISDRWKNTHQTCKDLIKMMENIKEFFDVFDSLDLWLMSKSRMMMVLGPISSDSRMVQSQVQQVQLLKEEFRVQQPQLQHLIILGNDIINMCSNTKDSDKIRNKLNGIESRWKDLLNELDTRAASLGTAADTSREFDDSLNRLKESLHTISDQLDDIVPSNKNPEDQLKKIESLERQLEGLRPLLADAEANGESLVDVLNDPASKNEIQSKLAAVGKQYNNLQKKLDNKKAEIENLLRDGRQFQETCSKTFGWLSEELNSLSEKLLISANKDILQQQLDNFEPVYRNITIHEHEVIMLLNKGRDILSKKPDKQLQREMDKIQQNWDKLKRGVSERYTRLQTCMEHCKKYYTNHDRFMPWLRNTEDTLDAMKPNMFKRKPIEKQLKDLQQFRSEIWRKSGEYETNRMLGDTFLSSCDTDKVIVQNELADMKSRWEKLNNDLIRLLQIFEDILSKLIDFNDQIRDVSHQIQRFEDRFTSLLNESKDAKSLSQIDNLKSEINTLQKPIKECQKLADDLINEAKNYNVNASYLIDEINQIIDRISDLNNKLNNRYDELKSTFSVVTQFNDKLKQITQQLSDLETKLENMSAVARDFKSLRNQMNEMNTFIDQLTNVVKNLNDVINSYNGITTNFDNGLLKQQIESIQKQYQKIEQNGKHRQNDISQVIKRLESFYTMYTNIMEDVKNTDNKLSNLKSTNTEIENIRTQQLDFKKLRKNIIEPLGKSVNECVKLGTNLIQTASSDVNVSVLEKDIETLQENWNELKEKLNERERKLDVGLLQFGKFQEALDSLNKWLTDIEEMVSNQKPPSADYKVVKAQLQEQKFLKKMLLDRQPSMSSLFSMANELSDDLNVADRKAIEKEIKDLRMRFNNLSENAQKRTLDLEQAMHVAKQFQEKLIPLEEWLNKIEKKIKDFQQVPTDEDRISAKIREHEGLHREILSKKLHFTDLAETASNLMSLIGEEEAVILTDKLQEVSKRYTDLVDLSESIGVLLTNSRHGLRHLVLTYQDLVSWIEGIERNLAKYRFLAVFPDQLIEQTESLVQLTEDISARQPDVDSTVESGVELMKHITSDEALQLKDKLDNIQRKFNELIGRGVELLKRAQYILPIVQQFHDKHAIISDWMSEAESLVNGVDITESEIARLEIDIGEMRPILETVTTLGPQLCQNASNDGTAMIEGLVTKDNRRFDAIVERIQRKAERINLGKQRALEVVSDIDELLEWFREVEQQVREAEAPSCEPDVIRVQLKEHKALNDDISSQKGRVRDLLSTSKKMLRESSSISINENSGLIREKMDDLRELMESVSKLSQDRLSILEQALPLSEHFHDTHNDLKIWLDEMEHQISILSKPALKADIITQQQDRNELFLQTVSEHKPLIDKLNKTGEALLKLCNIDDGVKIQEILDCDNKRYNLLKLELKQRERELESALQESSQFSDKLEGMLRALSNTAEQVSNLEPISAHPPKIRDQINDNRALIDDLNKRKQAYDTVKQAANDVLNKTINKSDPAIRDMNKKLSNLEKIWQEIEQATNDRSKSLDEALDAAQRFWKQLHSVMAVLKDLQNSIVTQEPPAADPKAIQKQQVALQEIRHEIDQTKPEVDKVRASGKQLIAICGDPDKPEVKKHIDDLDHAWDNVTIMFVKREENLIDAMEKAMEFYDVLQNLIKFLDVAERNFAKMGPIGSDIDEVMKQIKQLQKFKLEVDPYMVQVEAINRQAHDLTERTSSDQAQAIKKPLSEVNRRWDSLLHDMIERQQQLENALLRLGQFQHALNELLVWIDKTHLTLNDLKPVPGDVKTTEIEIAKLKVITNDIQAHENSIESLNIAGKQIIETGDDSSEALDKLAELNKKWDNLLHNSDNKQRELEDALRDAQMFQAEIQDLVSWLNDVDGVIAASKPVGGLPETANEQLERFMEVFNELEQTGPKIEAVLQQGQEYLRKYSNPNSNLQQNLKNLKSKWDSVLARANDKKIKLEIALKEATEFHDSLQAFIDWLTNTEKIVTNFKSVSRVMESILLQIEDHKILQKDVSVHRETMLNLDKKGSHLKYFSQKQDVILIKNLLISVQHRWERVVARVGERTRALDHGYKEAKEFYESWSHLINWLSDTEKALDEINTEHDFGTNAINIKSKLGKHQELQRALSAKQMSYDSVMKLGKQLKEKASKNDEPILKEMLQELKTKWTSVCSKCIERQRSLEEALLFSGQLSDAINALLSWLKSTEKELSTNKNVHGDLETVTMLIEEHKAFEQELKARENQYESVMRTGHDMESKVNSSEFADTHQNLITIESLWSSVSSLVNAKSQKLDNALHDAEDLHKSVHMLLDWLSIAEQRLRFVNSLPDDETEASHLQNELDKFLFELDEKEHVKNETIELAQQILEKAHPNAITIIKNWIKVIQTRWEEISTWARQKEQKLQSHMKSLHDLDEILEELLKWLLNLENTLTSLRKEPLPESIPLLESLIDDHREFMENTMKRHSEVNNICKLKQIKSPKESKKPSSRLRTPLRSSQLDLHRDISPQIGTGTLPRKQNKNETPINEYSCDPYPHIGPRFNANAMDAEFKTPRVKLLWTRWKTVWVLAWERQRALYSKLEYLKEVERVKNFSWDEWRKRFLKFMNHKKSRLTDLFRKMDKDNNGLIPREDFIEGIIRTKFETSRLEMNAVADLFDRNNSGLIDWEEFIAALRPDWVERKDTDAEKIHDEVKRLVMLCTCRQKFKVFQVGEGKYRFGESQKLRLVRILRSTVMVRVGGGWVALDEFLIKNDPCRAKGRTNIELREQFILADGVSQSMAAFKPRTSQSPRTIIPNSSGPITKIRERSQRSQPMSSYSGRTRSSTSAGTPDSLSDNENGSFNKSWRKTPLSNRVTPCGSRSNSRPNSRPPSRAGSKPQSRYGSTNSLDSIDTPSRIPRKSSIPSIRSKNVTENGSTIMKSTKKQTSSTVDTESKTSWKY